MGLTHFTHRTYIKDKPFDNENTHQNNNNTKLDETYQARFIEVF